MEHGYQAETVEDRRAIERMMSEMGRVGAAGFGRA